LDAFGVKGAAGMPFSLLVQLARTPKASYLTVKGKPGLSV